VRRLESEAGVTPELVAHDANPLLTSTAYAEGRGELEPVPVQHHHAHLAAVLAEHGEPGPAVGAIFDSGGYALDGTLWGGELLVGGLGGCKRAGLLFPVRLPGGVAAATREPWRMACAWLAAALGVDIPPMTRRLELQVSEIRWREAADLGASGVSSPLGTSAGRLTEAVAALCGLGARPWAGFRLRAAAGPLPAAEPYPLPLIEEGTAPLILDARPTILAVIADLEAGATTETVATRFHLGLADAAASACMALTKREGVQTVVLGGDLFAHDLLLNRTVGALEGSGIRLLLPLRLPAGDGGISLGQAAVAAHLESLR
jgi:hydrogenase maturation protein HypF